MKGRLPGEGMLGPPTAEGLNGGSDIRVGSPASGPSFPPVPAK